MLLRGSKKFSREVSLYEPIGLDKDGEVVNLMDVLGAAEPEMLDGLILSQDIRALYRAFRECLNQQERQVIRLRYGLFGQEPKTQREIAALLGISRSYVSRIEKRAIGKLREAMES